MNSVLKHRQDKEEEVKRNEKTDESICLFK